jgi:hypothetical protein
MWPGKAFLLGADGVMFSFFYYPVRPTRRTHTQKIYSRKRYERRTKATPWRASSKQGREEGAVSVLTNATAAFIFSRNTYRR